MESPFQNRFTFNSLTQIPAGSAAAPSIAPNGDPDTGIFFPAANVVACANAGSESWRSDSSGNLLVGATSTGMGSSGSATGIGLRGSIGYIEASRDGSPVGRFNRITSDGEIFQFAKDGAAVGSIGTIADDMFLGSNDTQLRFRDVTDAILPADSNGFLRNNAISVGQATAQIKDIHMAGTLYLDSNPVGGTEVTIADDAVASITPPKMGGIAMVSYNSATFPNIAYSQLVWFDTGGSLVITELTTEMGATVDVSTSDVTGTTGTDGNVTIAVQSGVLKIENRSNSSADFQVTFL